jgi:hypothetical protein
VTFLDHFATASWYAPGIGYISKVHSMPPTPDAFLDPILSGSSQVRLAFLYQSDTAAEYTRENGRPGDTVPGRLLGFELLSAHWFRRVWRRYLSVLGYGTLPGQLERALGQVRLQDGFNGLPGNLRQQLYEAHLRFGMRMLLESDPAPVGLAELVAGERRLDAEDVREGDWYLIEYHDGGRLRTPRQPARLDEIVYSTIGLSSGRDGSPRRGTVLDIVPLATAHPALNLLLQALHFPQADPQADARAGRHGRPVGSAPRVVMDASQHVRIEGTGADFPLTFARPGDQPAWTPAGLATLQFAQAPVGPPTTAAPPAHAAHAAAGPARPRAPGNPMTYTGSGRQPFVGVNMVGAGNNTALYGRDGIVAYVDFGAPLPVNGNTDPGGTPPCACGDPPMILSHWDYDHYAMARKVDGAWRRRWLAPQQVMGSVSARELYVRLLVSAPYGGALALWPVGTGPAHLEMPFGYIERGLGKPVNDDCLAVHVRTRDDPAGAPAAPWPAVFAARPVPAPAPAPARRAAIIVDNGSQAVWIDHAVAAAIGFAVALPGTTRLPAARLASLRIPSRWIPSSGLKLPPGLGGGTYTPVLPGGQPWPGGWALSASHFVQIGGCIVDFPPKSSGLHVENVMCVSPTPGTIWARRPGPALAPGPGGATWLATQSRWKPVWRHGGWLVQLPGPAAAALAPLPAGPTAITPAPGAAPVGDKEEYILLPGDAGFQHLPSLQERRKAVARGQAVPAFVGMLATHHGSDSWIPDDPIAGPEAVDHIPPARSAKIVYSYGTRTSGPHEGAHCYVKNHFGHPRPAAINAYCAAGWGMPEAAGAHAFNRLNTAPRDFDSRQPFNPLNIASGTTPDAANGKGHYNGNVALAPRMTPSAATLVHLCPHCHQQRSYFT